MSLLAGLARLSSRFAVGFAARLRLPKISSKQFTFEQRVAAPILSARPALVAAACFSGLMNLLMLSGSLFMLQVYDRVLPSRSVPTLEALLVLVVVLYAFFGLLELVRGRLFSRLGARFDQLLGGRIFDASLRRSPRGRPGELVASFRDLEQVRTFLVSGGPAALFDLPWAPLYLAFLFLLHPAIGSLGLVGIAVLSFLAWRTERLTKPLQLRASLALGEVSNWADCARRGAETIVPMGMTSVMRSRWVEKNAIARQSILTASDASTAYGTFSKFIRMALQSLMLALGAYLVMSGDATGGVMISSSILLGRALAPIELAIGHWRAFVASRQAYQRIMATVPAGDSPATSLPCPVSAVTVEKLSVALPGDSKPRLRDIAFSLNSGDALGVIGPSGSGKSTLARAIVGGIEGARGSVRFDGSPLDQWSHNDRSRIIGYLPQEVELFPGTVGQNISRFAPDAASSDILDAAAAAGIDRFIRGLPQGFDTLLGERGIGISVGERQRIALARALYGNPFAIILDEPNSALDADGESALVEAIARSRQRGAVVIIVAHRPSVLRAVNKVIVLAHGQQTDFGSRDEIFQKVASPKPAPLPRVAGGAAP